MHNVLILNVLPVKSTVCFLHIKEAWLQQWKKGEEHKDPNELNILEQIFQWNWMISECPFMVRLKAWMTEGLVFLRGTQVEADAFKWI